MSTRANQNCTYPNCASPSRRSNAHRCEQHKYSCWVEDCHNTTLRSGKARELCAMHESRIQRYGTPDAPTRPNSLQIGEFSSWYINDNGYRSRYRKTGIGYSREYQLEHRLVMEEYLGRPLLPGETVHHKNGVKTDNRPSNLELWVSHQPKGQRPKDLLEWADEIIARYRK